MDGIPAGDRLVETRTTGGDKGTLDRAGRGDRCWVCCILKGEFGGGCCCFLLNCGDICCCNGTCGVCIVGETGITCRPPGITCRFPDGGGRGDNERLLL